MDKENRIMEACKILMEECCDNDSNDIQVKVEYKMILLNVFLILQYMIILMRRLIK